MGRDKATLPYCGRPLLDTVAETLAQMTSPVYVVADTPERYHSPNTLLLTDAFPDVGPAGGIYTGLMGADSGVHLVVACDLPFLVPDLLRFLEQTLLDLSPESRICAVIPEIEGRLEPLHAAYSSLAVSPLKSALAQGERSLQKILRGLEIETIPEADLRRFDPDLKSFTNWNRPEDIE